MHTHNFEASIWFRDKANREGIKRFVSHAGICASVPFQVFRVLTKEEIKQSSNTTTTIDRDRLSIEELPQ
jgi:hypothetical protein